MSRNFKYYNLKTQANDRSAYIDLTQLTVKSILTTGVIYNRGGVQAWASMGMMALVEYGRNRADNSLRAPGYRSEGGYTFNKMSLESWVIHTTDSARRSVAELGELIFNGASFSCYIRQDGFTPFSDAVYSGAFLPGKAHSQTGYYNSAALEQNIKRAVMLRTLNQALRLQKIYIIFAKGPVLSREHVLAGMKLLLSTVTW